MLLRAASLNSRCPSVNPRHPEQDKCFCTYRDGWRLKREHMQTNIKTDKREDECVEPSEACINAVAASP